MQDAEPDAGQRPRPEVVGQLQDAEAGMFRLYHPDVVSLIEKDRHVMPGDSVTMDVALIVPVAMEEKLRFAIREGGRTVGAGVVAAIND